jgi:hypothetical protein
LDVLTSVGAIVSRSLSLQQLFDTQERVENLLFEGALVVLFVWALAVS